MTIHFTTGKSIDVQGKFDDIKNATGKFIQVKFGNVTIFVNVDNITPVEQ